MEQNFQTSFIPKKPMVKEHVTPARPISFLSIIGIFILFAVLLATGGLYFYKGIVNKSITKMQNDLELAKNRFEPSKITELKVLDRRLIGANEVLSRHIAISPIFEALQAVTMKSIRYTKFSYTFTPGDDTVSGNLGGLTPGETPKVKIKMTGVSLGYSYLALQSDLYTKNKNFIDPVFSNLALDEKGNVLFDLDFSVDPSFVDYKNILGVGDATMPPMTTPPDAMPPVTVPNPATGT